MGKQVITIDLNPLSRTAQTAHITIVDELTRCLPLLTEFVRDGAEVDLVGLNRASETNVDKLAIHDKPGAMDKLAAH